MGQRVFDKAWFYTRRNDRKRLRRLIAKRPQLRTSNESLILFNAIWHSPALVPWLLELGVSPDCRIGSHSNTPLMQAASEGQTSLIELLIHYGADLEAKNECNERPLGFACAWNQPDAARILLENGADPNTPEDDHATYLDWAVVSEHATLISVLMAHGALRYVELTRTAANQAVHLSGDVRRSRNG